MPVETIKIEFSEDDPQLLPAQVLAIIAYPEDRKNRKIFEYSLWYQYQQNKVDLDPEWGKDRSDLRAKLYLLEEERIEGAIKRGFKIIMDRRRHAGSIVTLLLNRENNRHLDGQLWGKATVDLSNLDKYPEIQNKYRMFLKNTTLNKAAEYTASSLNYFATSTGSGKAKKWNREEVFKQIWTPSMPVMYLIPYLCMALSEIKNPDINQFYGLLDHDWAAKALVDSGAQRELYIHLHGINGKEFNFPEENLIKFDVDRQSILQSLG